MVPFSVLLSCGLSYGLHLFGAQQRLVGACYGFSLFLDYLSTLDKLFKSSLLGVCLGIEMQFNGFPDIFYP